MILRFLHGWGFDASIWARVLPQLGEFVCRCDDRGYFGPAVEAAGEIAVTHSMGALRALASPGSTKALVAINGFDRFAAVDGFPGVAPRVIARMRAQLAHDPHKVVDEFRQRVGGEPAPPVRNAAALEEDLAMLAQADLRWAKIPTILLHAADDPLLTTAMQATTFAGSTERTTLDSGGHLLPVTRPEACAAAIRRAVERVA